LDFICGGGFLHGVGGIDEDEAVFDQAIFVVSFEVIPEYFLFIVAFEIKLVSFFDLIKFPLCWPARLQTLCCTMGLSDVIQHSFVKWSSRVACIRSVSVSSAINLNLFLLLLTSRIFFGR
jgi:hypothetical protein